MKTKLVRVTITGADDAVAPSLLADLSNRYPFVEWGVLMHRENSGQPRYPSEDWLVVLDRMARLNGDIHLSAHVCGFWARSMLIGMETFAKARGEMLGRFHRLQLNLGSAAAPEPCKTNDMMLCVRSLLSRWSRQPAQCIIQHGGVPYEDSVYRYAMDYLATQDRSAFPSVVPLLDASEGKGMLPQHWPAPPEASNWHGLIGYAGGLTPENVAGCVHRMSAAAADHDFWIDVETGVRKDDQFDSNKVVAFLEACKPFVAKPEEV